MSRFDLYSRFIHAPLWADYVDDDDYRDLFLEFVRKEWVGAGIDKLDYWPIEYLLDYICADFKRASDILSEAGVLDDAFESEFKNWIWDNYPDDVHDPEGEEEEEEEYDWWDDQGD